MDFIQVSPSFSCTSMDHAELNKCCDSQASRKRQECVSFLMSANNSTGMDEGSNEEFNSTEASFVWVDGTSMVEKTNSVIPFLLSDLSMPPIRISTDGITHEVQYSDETVCSDITHVELDNESASTSGASTSPIWISLEDKGRTIEENQQRAYLFERMKDICDLDSQKTDVQDHNDNDCDNGNDNDNEVSVSERYSKKVSETHKAISEATSVRAPTPTKFVNTSVPSIQVTIFGVKGTYNSMLSNPGNDGHDDLNAFQTSANGIGKIEFEDGSCYEGEFQNGLMQGIGKMIWSDGSFYHGSWHQGLQHGMGYEYDSNKGECDETFWTHGEKSIIGYFC